MLSYPLLIKLWQEYELSQAQEEAKVKDVVVSREQKRQQLRKEQTKLVRVNITNHNPAKSKLTGEIFTVGNSILGYVRKFIPYNCDAAQSYHIPFILYNTLKKRKYTMRTTRMVDGKPVVSVKEANEFSFEVLPQLSETELKELARKQAMSKGVEVD